MAAQPTYNAAHHFPDLADSAVEYEYDQNGNMTKDLKIPSKREQGELVRHAEREVFGMKFNRDITSIEYNSLNLPGQISFSDLTKMKFTYDAAGNKLKAEYWTVPSMVGPVGPASLGGGAEPMGGGIVGPINPINQNDPQVVTDYCGDMIYRNDTLSMLLTEEGYVTFATDGSPTYHYYLRDHLGSVRIVMRQDGTVEQRNQYYPDGTLFGKQSTGGTVQPYKFGGKELERTLPLDGYDFGARWMDPVVGGRFTTMDPLCEKYYNMSPYAYCGGDPVNLVDPSGEKIIPTLYKEIDNHGNAVGETNKVHSNLFYAGFYFSQTSYGKQIISDFLSKDERMYGIEGNGKYSQYSLYINQYELPFDQNLHVDGDGFFRVEDNNGQLEITIGLNMYQNQYELIETMNHEFSLHGYKIDDIIKIYEDSGIDAVNDYLISLGNGEFDHNSFSKKDMNHEGVQLYYQTKEELISNNPYLKRAFDDNK